MLSYIPFAPYRMQMNWISFHTLSAFCLNEVGNERYDFRVHMNAI